MTKNTIEQNIALIFLRLDSLEKMLAATKKADLKPSENSILKEKLDRLTIKRHAVLTATLGGVGYAEIAKLMSCDETTVKLHLKAALNLLEVSNRSALLVSHKDVLDSIPELEYESRYHLSKRWWLEQKPGLMDVLKPNKPHANQHTKVTP
jgi:DNA-binding CsgD family transcriptional regulator